MVQAKNGILLIVIPGARMPRMVATKFTAAEIVPIPLTMSPIAQKSVPGPRAKAGSVNGA